MLIQTYQLMSVGTLTSLVYTYLTNFPFISINKSTCNVGVATHLSSYHFRFIEKYGTHVIVGVKIGGTDIIYAKQQYSSPVQPSVVQKKLKDMADEFFVGGKVNEKEKV